MGKHILIALLLALIQAATAHAQDMRVDSLELLLKRTKEDTTKANILGDLSFRYAFSQPEKGFSSGLRALALSQKTDHKNGVANAYKGLSMCSWAMGDYNIALHLALKALHLYEETINKEQVAWMYMVLSSIYRDTGDYKRALSNAQTSLRLHNASNLSTKVPAAITGSIYELMNQLDSAQAYVQEAYEMEQKDNLGKWGWLPYLLGNIQAKRKQYDSALFYYRKAIPLALEANTPKDIVDIYNSMASVYREIGPIDSAIHYSSEVLQNWSSTSYLKGVTQASGMLAGAYKILNEKDSTIKYLEMSVDLQNRLFNLEKERDIQNLTFNEQLRKEEIERDKQQLRNELKLYGLLSAGVVLLGIALLLWRNIRQRQKAYLLLQRQKQETDRQKLKTEKALEELRSTQFQLVQREKMASLGELTAGIAHEIQNPLNFVNNFSELGQELCDEVQEEVRQLNVPPREKRNLQGLVSVLSQNQEKVLLHGQRADAIVKGMLEHSRATTGEKRLTDINALVNKYLRLSYSGFRAKNKEFTCTLDTCYDQKVGEVEAVTQDLGRVLLNLFNNAFYALQQKQRLALPDYEPQVRVSTLQLGNKVEVRVFDNGTGIPEKVRGKIFQPFFTTKPVGQGTGLGLSLSYDIITKVHGGELSVATEEGEWTEFNIILPYVPLTKELPAASTAPPPPAGTSSQP